MEIVMKPIGDLIPYERNQKKHDAKQIENVANSIKRFGWQQPIVVDKKDVVVIGHCRLLAAKKLKLKEVPVTVADNLTEDEIRELRIADNKTNESAWDEDFLKEDLKELGFEGFDFDFGFDIGMASDQEAREDDYEVVVPEEATSKLGELYQLGRHRLLVGDSTSRADVERLMGGQKADLLLTDPPYNVSLGSSGSAQRNDKKRNRQENGDFILNDSMEDTAFRKFLTDVFSNAKAAMKAGAAFYIWHADSESVNFRLAARDAGLQVHETLIWNKNSLVLGRMDYQMKHEPCLYGWCEGAGHSWYSDRKQTSVLDFDRPTKSELHPTMKPIPLFDYQIRNSSKAGDNVLDMFGGSGTTMMCCEQDNRNAFLMELDPKYADVIIDRWEKLTGEKAVKLDA